MSKYPFEFHTKLFVEITFTLTDVISCGNSIMSPSCNLCPKLNNTGFDIGCGGNCKIEETTGICKDECKIIESNLILRIHAKQE